MDILFSEVKRCIFSCEDYDKTKLESAKNDIRNNYFDRAAYRMIHTVAYEQESCPTYDGNTYIQTLGGTLNYKRKNFFYFL